MTVTFVHWNRKKTSMPGLLAQTETYVAMYSKYIPNAVTEVDKNKIEKKCLHDYILNLFDKVLRETSDQTIAKEIIFKLDDLYLKETFSKNSFET